MISGVAPQDREYYYTDYMITGVAPQDREYYTTLAV